MNYLENTFTKYTDKVKANNVDDLKLSNATFTINGSPNNKWSDVFDRVYIYQGSTVKVEPFFCLIIYLIHGFNFKDKMMPFYMVLMDFELPLYKEEIGWRLTFNFEFNTYLICKVDNENILLKRKSKPEMKLN